MSKSNGPSEMEVDEEKQIGPKFQINEDERHRLQDQVFRLEDRLLKVTRQMDLYKEDGISCIETVKETLADTSALANGLEEQTKTLTQENEKLKESIVSRDTEWERAIVDLTRFLSSSCDSLEDASDSIDSLVSAFPKREALSLVNSHVERAIRASLERERLVHDLRERLRETRRVERGLKGKLDCLRGATLAMSELHQRELLEQLHGPGASEAMFLDETVSN